MGPINSNEKEKEFGRSDFFQFGNCSITGCRNANEDHFVTKNSSSFPSFKHLNFSFFGLFDGHTNMSVSKICGEKLLDFILDDVDNPEECTQSNFLKKDDTIVNGFRNLDEYLRSTTDSEHNSMCSSIFIIPRTSLHYEVISANLGTTWAIFYDNGDITTLTTSHGVDNKTEMERMERIVNRNEEYKQYRSEDNLSKPCHFYESSRSFGCFIFKKSKNIEKHVITSLPSITRHSLKMKSGRSNGYSFIVLGTSPFFKSEKNVDEYNSCICNQIIKKLKEQENGEYYENEEKRTKELIEKYRTTQHAPGLIQSSYEPLVQKVNEIYDIDGIAGELCESKILESISPENTTCTIILLRGRMGFLSKKIGRSEVEIKDELDRVEFLKELGSQPLKNDQKFRIIFSHNNEFSFSKFFVSTLFYY